MKKIFTLFLGVIIAVNVWAEEETTTTITDNGNGIYSYVYSEDGSTIIGLQLVGVADGATSLTIQTSITVEGTSYGVISIASDAFSDKDNCWWVSKIYVYWDSPIDAQLDDTYLKSFNSTPYLYVPATSIDSYFNSDWASYFPIAFTQDDYTYEVLTSDATSRTVSIIGHPSISGDYTLPSFVKVTEVTTYDITEIEAWAFQGTGMTSLTIPNTYTTIGGGAFLQNTQLTTVTFEEGSQLALFEQQLFNGCTALETIEIPSSVTSIGYATFNDCSSLKTVTFEEDSSLETIGESAFYNCSSLIKIEIPSGVTTIDDDAFKGCSSLEDVTIPATVTSIGGGNFEGCSLTSLTITGDAMTTTLKPTDFDVEENSGCVLYVTEGLEHEYYEAGWGEYFTIDGFLAIGVKFTYDGLKYKILTLEDVEDVQQQYTVSVVGYTGDLPTELTIPSEVSYDYSDQSFTVTEIAEYAFLNTKSITSVTIPATITTIGYEAFGNCIKLETLTFEANSSLEIIDTYTFRNCSSLETIEIPASVTTINCNVFEGCSALTTVTYEENSQLQSIGCYAFQDCTSLTTVNIPTDCETIEYDAFNGCTSLETIEIPASVTTINCNVFEGCSTLTTVTFEENSQLQSIGCYAFQDCTSLTTVNIPTGCETIGHDAFNGCTSLETIEIPSSVKEIGWFAFGDCSALETATFGEDFSPEYFNMYTFYNCKSLTKIEIPSSVTIIGSNVFEGCTALEEVVFGENSSLEIIYPSVFLNCTSLTKIEFPSGVTTIDDGAFSGCSSLEDVTLPATASVGENCFEGCPLTSLTITGNEMTTTLSPTDFDVEENSGCVLYVTEGLEHEYYETGWATYFTINNYIEGTEIADEESGLTYEITDQYTYEVKIVGFTCTESVTIPVSITYNEVGYTITAVDENVFNCNVLKEVTMEATEPPFDAAVFENIADGAVLIVPEGAKEAYSSWSDSFTEILDGTERSTALINIYSDKVEVVRYNLLGQKIFAPQRGINIVKYSDGTVEKVLVK